MLCTRYTTVMKQLAELAAGPLDSQKMRQARSALQIFYMHGPENFDVLSRLNAARLELKLAGLIPDPAPGRLTGYLNGMELAGQF